MKEGNTKTIQLQETPKNVSKYFLQITCPFYFENRTLESEVTKRISGPSNYFQDCSKAEVFSWRLLLLCSRPWLIINHCCFSCGY